MRTVRRVAILAAIGVAVAAAAPPAGASIFFDDGAFAIGWAPANGIGAKQKLVKTKHPWAVAANRTYVYWARLYCCGGKTQFIGRARHDGSHVRQAFITIPGLSRAEGGINSVAVDARHVYWTNGNVIGRANLDGSNVQPAVIAFPENMSPVDVQASGGRLYFRLNQIFPSRVLSIGRVDATGANLAPALITGIPLGAGLAVDGRHIYWDQGENVRAIGRADLDGSHIDQHFIDVRAQGLAVGGGFVYWSTFPTGVIGRARIDGTRVQRSFVRGVRRAHTLAFAP